MGLVAAKWRMISKCRCRRSAVGVLRRDGVALDAEIAQTAVNHDGELSVRSKGIDAYLRNRIKKQDERGAMMAKLRSGNVTANEIDFHYVEMGSGPLALCLHGFPDNAYTYRYLMPILADAGMRAVAVFMRGYAPTGRPASERYESILLAQDATALISALGADQAFIVGHDWGGFATLAAAVLAPASIRKIVTLGVAHPNAMGGDYDSLKGGWHGYFFQMAYAEHLVAANDYDFILRWWRDASPEYDPPPEIIESVKSTFRHPGVLTAALNYYRHTINPANRDPALASMREKIARASVPVPTLAFHGAKDRPGRLPAFERMDRYFSGGLEKVVMPGAGHFVHLEQPSIVNAKIAEFLKS